MSDPIADTLRNPPLAVGLNGLMDWSPAQPFVDHFKMARPWAGVQDGRYGVTEFQALQDQGVIDPKGWLLAVPPQLQACACVLLTEQDPQNRDLAGIYHLTWQGEAEIELLGCEVLDRGPNHIRFDFTPDFQDHVELRVNKVIRGPLRDIRVIRDENLTRAAAGQVFRPEWLDVIRNFRLLRFMDWMFTNNSLQQDWSGRPQPDDAFYTWRGAPVEVMVQLANEVGADPWFNIPHLASDDYIARFVGHVRQHLSPKLRPCFEFSNEMWNMQFGQTQWAIEQARRFWPDQGDGFMQYYADRSVNMALIVDRIYADAPQGCVKVISSQTHWLGLEGAALEAPNWRADDLTRKAPAAYFDAYAVSGYFDGGMDKDDNVAAVRALLDAGSMAQARTALRNQLLHGGWPDSGRTIASLRETWDYHAAIADTHGLALIMYEGGSHIVPPPKVQADPHLSQFYERFNYSAEMGQIYTAALDEWVAAGGRQFNLFVECARPGQFGYWGLQRFVDDENPRWAAVAAWNAGHAGPKDRGADDFIGSYEQIGE